MTALNLMEVLITVAVLLADWAESTRPITSGTAPAMISSSGGMTSSASFCRIRSLASSTGASRVPHPRAHGHQLCIRTGHLTARTGTVRAPGHPARLFRTASGVEPGYGTDDQHDPEDQTNQGHQLLVVRLGLLGRV